MPDPGPGQVRVTVAATSFNGIDGNIRGGYMQGPIPVELPHTPGIDVAGTVDALVVGCGGLLGVNRGSVEEPRLVTLRYTPADSDDADDGGAHPERSGRPGAAAPGDRLRGRAGLAGRGGGRAHHRPGSPRRPLVRRRSGDP